MTKSKFNPGTYTGKGKGIGDLSVSLTVNESEITKASLDLKNESRNVGQSADEELAKQIIDKQSADIDGVTGASLTTKGVKAAVKDALRQAEGKAKSTSLALTEGSYIGYGSGHGGQLAVKLDVFDHRIGDLKIISSHETPNVGDEAVKLIPKEIVSQQTLNVDAVSGATLTSKAIISASEDAVEKAGGNLAAWTSKAYHRPLTINHEDLTADVVIAGAGLSGLMTGAFAATKGLDVVVVAKGEQVGGSSRYAGAVYALANSKLAKKQGIDNSIDSIMTYVDNVNADAQKAHDREFMKKLMTESGKTFDQLVSMTNTKGTFIGQGPIVYGNFANGARVDELLSDIIKKHGGKIILNSRVTQILTDGDKATGIKVESKDGSDFTITAGSVVMATGGASYAPDLLKKNTPAVASVHVFNQASRENTADGYQLLQEIGAAFSDNDVYKNGNLDFNPQLYITWNNVPDYSTGMIIDSQAKRFTNEAPYDSLKVTSRMYRHGSDRYYLLYDDENLPEILRQGIHKLDENAKLYVTAASVAELAEKLSLDEKQLERTFASYKQAAADGNDEFGKPQSKIRPLNEKQLYAFYVMPGSWGTIGGVKINHDTFAVKKADGSDFRDLYAVGEMSTSDLFTEYYMGGFSYACYSTEGRLLAEELYEKL
ncbi:FAD-dependent oxidoreductase [Lactobacillus sp.]|uniref:FAD-dependent oxidoreductase n=1 Tax=Lactobacillus sp. TaxID=1591 RepID=UPI003EFE8A97